VIDNRTAAYAATVLRLSLAGFFLVHLYRKFAVAGFGNWWSGLEQAGYADWMLSYTVAIEFAAATLLLLGIYSRYVSILALPVMIAVTNHMAVRRGFWFSDGGAEFPLAWTAMLIVQALLGDGAYAVKVPAAWWKRAAQPAVAPPKSA
jgi:putative oxidoreductase